MSRAGTEDKTDIFIYTFLEKNKFKISKLTVKIMKRLILLLGGKGGTGKTTFGRLITDELHCRGINYLAFDADKENPDLHAFYKEFGSGVQLLNLLDVSQAKNFFTKLREAGPDVVVCDLPGATGEKLREIITAFNLFQVAENLGYRCTIVSVLNLSRSPIASLRAMYNFCNCKVDYVVVRNLCWAKPGDFTRWEGSETRRLILEAQGIEIQLPSLESSVFDLLEDRNIAFSNATEENSFPFGDYLMVNAFLSLARPELAKAGEYLGFE